MQFTLYYSADPNTVRVRLHQVQLIQLPATVRCYFNSDTQYIADISYLPGITKVTASTTVCEITITKELSVTWNSVFMKILEKLRDRFAPGEPITHAMMLGLPRCSGRDLAPGDFICPPRPYHHQLLLQ